MVTEWRREQRTGFCWGLSSELPLKNITMALFRSFSRLSRPLSGFSAFSINPTSHLRDFCTNPTSDEEPSSGYLSDSAAGSADDQRPSTGKKFASGSVPETESSFKPAQRPLEDGMDPGIYKAILVGQVGQLPVQKRLKSGRIVTLFSVGTGGIRNNRRPFDNEEPREYAGRCAVQWHRVAVYPERLGGVVLKHVKPGSILYLEGNLETKVFSDPITGLVKRIREIAIRRDGRLVFLGKEKSEAGESTQSDIRRVGYF